MAWDLFLGLCLLKNPQTPVGSVSIRRLLGTPESLLLCLSLTKVELLVLFYFLFLKVYLFG